MALSSSTGPTINFVGRAIQSQPASAAEQRLIPLQMGSILPWSYLGMVASVRPDGVRSCRDADPLQQRPLEPDVNPLAATQRIDLDALLWPAKEGEATTAVEIIENH